MAAVRAFRVNGGECYSPVIDAVGLGFEDFEEFKILALVFANEVAGMAADENEGVGDFEAGLVGEQVLDVGSVENWEVDMAVDGDS